MSVNGRRNVDSLILTALAGGATNAEAAARAGVSERTVQRRRQEPAFQDRLAELHDRIMERSLGMMLDAQSEAIATLRLLLHDDQPPTVRMGAARALVQEAQRTHEAVDVARRLRALEALLKQPRSSVTRLPNREATA